MLVLSRLTYDNYDRELRAEGQELLALEDVEGRLAGNIVDYSILQNIKLYYVLMQYIYHSIINAL